MFIGCSKRFRRFYQLGKRVCLGTLACLGLGCPSWSWSMDEAALPESPVFSLHGFGTLGLTRTNEDSAQFVRDLTQPNGADTRWTAKVDSLLGIQANVRFSPSTEGVVQVMVLSDDIAKYDAIHAKFPAGTEFQLFCTYRGAHSTQPGWFPGTRASTAGLRSSTFGTLASGPHAAATLRYLH